MRHKQTFRHLFVLLIIALGLTACNNEIKENELTQYEKEALSIADSISDTDELYLYITKYKKAGDKKAELLIRQRYGKYLRDKSMFEKAIFQHDTCITLAQELHDTIQLIIAYNNQGTNFRRLGDIQEATDLHYQALNLCDKIAADTSAVAKKNISRTLNGLGNVLLSLKNYDAAESIFRSSLNSEANSNNLTGIAINLANIGSVKEHKGESDSALIYYKQSLEHNISADNTVGICLCYMYIGKLIEKKGDMENALKYYQKSYNIGVLTGDLWHWLEPCISIGSLYINTHQMDSARKYLETGLTTAYTIHSIDHLARLHELFAKMHEMNGNYAQAITDIHISQAFNDSIEFAKSQNHMQNLRVNYESNKVRIAEEKARAERRISNIILVTGCIIIFIVIITITLLLRLLKTRREISLAKEKVAKERQEFYRGVTHQLRTPLTVVIGMTEQLRKFIPEGDAMAKREFDAVGNQCQQLLTLVTEMIEFSKNGQIKQSMLSEYAPNNSEESLAKLQEDIRNQEMQNNGNNEGNYIILAEDNPDVALLITEMLKNEGYHYSWAKDGQEAWEMMKKNMPELLITDIMMPRLDGIQLMRNVRSDESMNHMPIIVVSARVENEDRLSGIEAGAEVYLGKPFMPDELLLRIRKLLEQRLILRNKFMTHIQGNTVPDTIAVHNEGKAASATIMPQAQEEKISDTPVVTTPVVKETDSDPTLAMSGKEKAFLEKVDEKIKANMTNTDLSSALLAEILGTTTSTLNRKLKNLTDIDTTHYIRMHRIAKAKELLSSTEMTMVEIQMACGFETPSYFSRSFRADVGMTPSEYRKKGYK